MPALNRLFARCLALVLALTLSVQPALAQSILRDAETEILLHDMATPLIRAAGLDPRNVSIVLIGDMSINAFVAGGQAVYVNAGLINEAGSALEVQGVIAHELGHAVIFDIAMSAPDLLGLHGHLEPFGGLKALDHGGQQGNQPFGLRIPAARCAVNQHCAPKGQRPRAFDE